MNKAAVIIAAVVATGAVTGISARQMRSAASPARPAATPQATAALMPAAAQNALVAGNCATCHDDDAKTAGLSLQSFDAANLDQMPGVAEKMVRKLRAGMMPPASVTNRPDARTLDAFAEALESRLDRI